MFLQLPNPGVRVTIHFVVLLEAHNNYDYLYCNNGHIDSAKYFRQHQPFLMAGLLPSTRDFDDILVTVAKRVRKDSEIDTLGKKLGFSPEDIHGYIATNFRTQNVTYDGTLQMLRDWRDGQTNSTERGALKTALEQSGQIRLADELFPSSQ